MKLDVQGSMDGTLADLGKVKGAALQKVILHALNRVGIVVTAWFFSVD